MCVCVCVIYFFVFGFSLTEWYLETKIRVPSMLIVIGMSLILSPWASTHNTLKDTY